MSASGHGGCGGDCLHHLNATNMPVRSHDFVIKCICEERPVVSVALESNLLVIYDILNTVFM